MSTTLASRPGVGIGEACALHVLGMGGAGLGHRAQEGEDVALPTMVNMR